MRHVLASPVIYGQKLDQKATLLIKPCSLFSCPHFNKPPVLHYSVSLLFSSHSNRALPEVPRMQRAPEHPSMLRTPSETSEGSPDCRLFTVAVMRSHRKPLLPRRGLPRPCASTSVPMFKQTYCN